MTGQSFQRQDRLTKAEEFQYVFANARRFGNTNFTLLTRENELGYPRLGLAIAKKNVKLAVGRNRIKRLIRENFRHHKAGLPSIDIIAMCRSGAVELSNQEIRTQLDAQWRYICKKLPG
ncbi:MAG: ribonuclease P protein component [Proteobacteria bacterium]|nr:MAG: ribonuclease P protein component [Pseudomonadota bacterium]